VLADINLELPEDRTDISRLTDWVEAYMLVSSSEHLSEEDIREFLRAQTEGIEELSTSLASPDEWDEAFSSSAGDDPARNQAELILAEISRREKRCTAGCSSRAVYPFSRTADGVERRDANQAILYEFLLWLSIANAPFRRETYGSKVTRFFDLLGQAVLVAYLGPGATARRFGWPPFKDRPKRLDDALDWLAVQMGTTRDEMAPVNPDGKDAGVDVVAWRPFADNLRGYVVILAQCTVSQNAFVQKLADIKERLWSAFLRLGHPPVTAMLVPFDVSSADEWQWEQFHYAVGIVIDRPRIVELLCSVEPIEIPEYKRIAAWTRQKRRALVV